MKTRFIAAACAAIALAIPSFSQDVVTTPAPVSTTAPIPHYVRYSGTFSEGGSKPLQVRFALYENQTGGQPVWSEIQTVTPAEGKYAVLLGAGTENGLPQSVFSAAQARWLGITVGAGQELPRTILLATPYSLEASDAQTLAGHPASDFVLAGTKSDSAPASTTKKPNTNTDISLIDVTTGLTITNGGTGPTVTMGIDATKVPLLASANTFTATQTISAGNLAIPATTSKTSGTITSGGSAIFQTFSKNAGANNLFLGAGSGNFTNSGKNNTGVGNDSLGSLTTAAGNMGLGASALSKTSSGSYNTGIGGFAGYYNTTGSYNTYIGNSAGPASGNGALTNSTAIGASSVVGESNAMVLGGTGSHAVKVGIGTTTPAYTLDVQGTGNFTGNVNFAGSQSISGSSTSTTSGLLTVTNSSSGYATYATSASGNAVYAAGTNGLIAAGSSTIGTGVYASGLTGVEGQGSSTANSIGVYGIGPYFGVEGVTESTSAGNYGVYGSAPSGGSASGVYGVLTSASTLGSSYAGAAGIWADTNVTFPAQSLLASADGGYAGHFINNSSQGAAAVLIQNYDTTGAGIPLYVSNTTNSSDCSIDESADLNCTGMITGSNTPADKPGEVIETYAVQSAGNWIEDAGSAQLTHGAARVALDGTFVQTVNSALEYHVFLTPKGDCKGLYVTNESPTGFEVHELGGGSSDIEFDYRIMAKRRGYESVRLRDITAKSHAIAAANSAHISQRTAPAPRAPELNAR